MFLDGSSPRGGEKRDTKGNPQSQERKVGRTAPVKEKKIVEWMRTKKESLQI